MFKFAIGMPVIWNGQFANITGRDNGAEMWIIELANGSCRTVADGEIELDLEALDNDFLD